MKCATLLSVIDERGTGSVIFRQLLYDELLGNFYSFSFLVFTLLFHFASFIHLCNLESITPAKLSMPIRDFLTKVFILGL